MRNLFKGEQAITYHNFYVWRLTSLRFYQCLQVPCFGEGGEAAVVGAFDVVGKTACGKLLAAQVVLEALAADALAAASRVAAITEIHIRLFLTFHENLRFLILSIQSAVQ
jgi:hypothetical protein